MVALCAIQKHESKARPWIIVLVTQPGCSWRLAVGVTVAWWGSEVLTAPSRGRHSVGIVVVDVVHVEGAVVGSSGTLQQDRSLVTNSILLALYNQGLKNTAKVCFRWYSLVPIKIHGSINRHTSFISPCIFSIIWGVTINWINTQFWSTFDKSNKPPIAYTFVGVSFDWIVTFSMLWGVTNNWNMFSNWNQRHTCEYLDF